VGGFDEEFHGVNQFYEDQVMLAKICMAYPVFVAGECWMRYRRHADSCMSRVRAAGKAPQARQFFLEFLERYLSQNGLASGEPWRAVQEQLREFRHPLVFNLLRGGRAVGRVARDVPEKIARKILPHSMKNAIRRAR